MSRSSQEDDSNLLTRYVQVALEQLDRGEDIDPNVICAEHPSLSPQLVEVLGLSEHLPDLQRLALSEDPLSGLVLAGRYTLQECIGRGAMGVVYNALDGELTRSVAIKILDARLFNDPAAESRFDREAQALAQLRHPNIITVYDRGRTPEGIHFLVLELLDGMTLARVLAPERSAEPPIDTLKGFACQPITESHWPRLVAKWCAELADGLATSHQQSIIHRDIKPSNIQVTSACQPILLDFGIARTSQDARLTATDAILGTPAYMAPELATASSEEDANPESDIYSLGATMYHLLGGEAPYAGNIATILMQLQQQDPTPLHHQQADLPRDLVAIVERCMERSSNLRYSSALALKSDLDCFLAHQPVTARPTTALSRRWRKWRRAPAIPLAVMATMFAILVAVIAAPLFAEQHEQSIKTQKSKLYRSLPALLAIDCWPNERVLSELKGEHEVARAQLDELLALDPNDMPTRLWRACLLLDLGNSEGASADLQFIADNEGSPYFRELANRYRKRNPSLLGAEAIDLTDIPNPSTPSELYVAGFHELRNRHIEGYSKRAEAFLRRASSEYLPARDLRLLALASLSEQPKRELPKGTSRQDLIQELYDETIALEAIYGQQTARTCAMRGVALLMQGNYADAIVELNASLAIRPDRHAPHHNLGIAYRRIGDLVNSDIHLKEALRIHPFAWNSRYTRAILLRDQSQFSAAWKIMEDLETTGERGEAWKHAKLSGSLALRESLHLINSDPPTAAALAKQAIKSFETLVEIRSSRQNRSQLARAQAILSDDESVVLANCAALILNQLTSTTPEFHYELATLAHVIAKHGIDPTDANLIAAVLRRIAAHQAPEDNVFVDQQESQIQMLIDTWQKR